ncbi:MAG TPA: tetratricopeptide repeat protein [Casimicrobiaceae bacterium]|nr:tetratricopeptide repeat protein [Casimicrobiaceae bacterium]
MPATMSANALIEQGQALLASNDPQRAAECFRAALRLSDDAVGAHFGLGVALTSVGQSQAAVEAFERVLTLAPAHAGVHFNLGQLARRRGDADAAIAHYRNSLVRQPGHVPSLVNLGLLLLRESRHEEALPLLEAALAIDPKLPTIRGRVGIVLCELEQYSDSIPYLEAAVAENGDDVRLVNAYSLVLNTTGENGKAIAALKRLLTRVPGASWVHSNLLMLLHFAHEFTPDEIYAEHLRWAQMYTSHIVPCEAEIDDPDPQRSLRVGLVTPHVVAGPVPSVLLSLLEHHDRRRLEFIMYVNSSAADAVTDRLRAATAGWRRIDTQDDDAFAAAIRADRFDILIDLAGHSAGNRLLAFARRLAPIQVTWLDYFDTTGVPAIDYLLTDPVHTPADSHQRFTERILRLPVTRLCFVPPGGAPEVAPAPALRQGHLTFGSFNRYAKTELPVVALWARLLDAIPRAQLVLKAKEFVDRGIRARALARFAAHGVRGDRIELRGPSPPATLLTEYADIDIALDTFPHNGGATTMDALWMGVPVLTLSGKTMRGRQSAAMLHAAGLPEFVATTADEFIVLATRWNADSAGLAVLRNGMRPRVAASALCDGLRFARDFEIALRGIWRAHCAARAA